MADKTNRKEHKQLSAAMLLLLTVALAGAGVLTVKGVHAVFSTVEKQNETAGQQTDQNTDDTQTDAENSGTGDGQTAAGTSSFTFTGVGDNLLHDPIFVYYEQDTGGRDFLPIYQNTMEDLQSADLAYINFETVCAGDDFGLSGYPSFNGPVEMIDVLSQTGIDWISTASNHSLDVGVDGLMAEMGYISEHDGNITYTGTHISEDSADDPVIRDVNGIRVGLATFTYDMNGIPEPEGYEWVIDNFLLPDGSVDYDLMQTRIDALNAASDVQIVSMHWGEEYQTEPNATQREVAQWLHDQGVEVIIGTHPHVIQPVELIEDENQTTLVYYSLGNFLSAQNHNYTMVGGMADFTLNYDFNTKKTTFSDIRFIPTVTWISPNLRSYRTNTISTYTDEMAADHYVSTVMDEDMSRTWVQEYVSSVVGNPEGIEIVYE